MKKQVVLRAVFSLLAILTVVGAVFLSQRNARAVGDNDPWASAVQHEFFFAGGGGRLGIQLEEVTADNMGRYRLNEEAGAIVKSVDKDSPAEKAGLQEGDVIVNYAGTPVYSVAQLTRMVRETPANRTVSLGILRNGSPQTLQVKVGGPSAHAFTFPGDAGKWAEELARTARDKARIGDLSARSVILGRPRLGVGLEDLTEQMAAYFGVKDGVLITSVSEDSPAAKAGLRAGDIITAIDNKPVKESFEVIRSLGDKTEGGPVTLTIVRDKRPMTVTVNLEKVERPERVRTRTRGMRL